jgi:hypothetical protein
VQVRILLGAQLEGINSKSRAILPPRLRGPVTCANADAIWILRPMRAPETCRAGRYRLADGI